MSDYDLKPFRYRELKYLCMQYEDFKVTLAKLDEEDGYAVATTDPTSEVAIKREQYSRVINLIEKTAEDTEPFLKDIILQMVTSDVVISAMSNSCTRDCLEQLRRKFYYLFSNRWGI